MPNYICLTVYYTYYEPGWLQEGPTPGLVAPNYVLKVDTYNSACFFTHQRKKFSFHPPNVLPFFTPKRARKVLFMGFVEK